jgi:hypothetical protein
MAETWTDEGLDFILGLHILNAKSVITTTYLTLFTSQTATTVPARTATGGASPSGWTEATGTAYARKDVLSTDWGAIATDGSGRRSTSSQQTFATVGAGGWGTVNGFGLIELASAQAGDETFWFANFDDTTAVTLNQNDQILITPTEQFDI